MQTISHIDIAEYDRIQALLDDPANYVWQAVDSERLDGWVPDFGLTNYDTPSIYRPPSIANSGLASQLRHRFWRSDENGRDHRGERYIGVLLYDALGDDSPMELRLASEDIGRISPTRHDNHRHLIVADKPATFVGGMEIFQVKAPGKPFTLSHRRLHTARSKLCGMALLWRPFNRIGRASCTPCGWMAWLRTKTMMFA